MQTTKPGDGGILGEQGGQGHAVIEQRAFLKPLPGRIARVDKRAAGFHKILPRRAAMMYSSLLNDARSEIEFMDFIPGPRLMEDYPLEPFPEGEKLRARFVAKNPEMKEVMAKLRADEINSVQD